MQILKQPLAQASGALTLGKAQQLGVPDSVRRQE